MTNETTPDAVERQYQDSDGNPCDLVTLCRREPEWAANRIDTLLAERARHAEEVARLEAVHLSALETIEAWKLASGLECGGDPDGVTPAGMRRYWEGVEADRDSLRAQLRRVEGERDAERKHATEMEERALDLVRDLRLANVELTSLRSLLPDVRALARWAIVSSPWRPIEDYLSLAPGEYMVRMKRGELEEHITIARWTGAEWRVRIADVERYDYRAEHITHLHDMGPIRGPGRGER